MNFEDVVVVSAIASGATVAVLTLTAYRPAVVRALRAFGDRLRRFRPWQVAAAAFALLLLYAMLDPYAYRSGLPFLLAVGGIAVGFTVAWVREFLFLMALRDEDLPGRFDKPIWAAVLILLAPLGLFLFRSHRLAHWPEPEPKPRMAPGASRDLI